MKKLLALLLFLTWPAFADNVVFPPGGGTSPPASPIVNVRDFGAKGDGVSNDSPAFVAALATLPAGGLVYVPPSGHSYVLGFGITLPSNIELFGAGLHHWQGLDFSDPSVWASSGSWLQCNDTTNPCISITGVGDHVHGLNFIYAQPAPPSSGTWTPTAFPYTILVGGSANFTGLNDLSITAGTNCIDWEGPSSGVAGLPPSYMRDIYFNGCFNVGTRFHLIDNTLDLDALHYINWWYNDQTNVQQYMLDNTVDWDVQYLADPQASNIEFLQARRAIQLTNGTVTSGFGTVTFATSGMRLANVTFNEVCQAIVPTSPDVQGEGQMTGVIAYRNTSSATCSNSGPAFFDFSSAPTLWQMSNIQSGFVQTFADIGPSSDVAINQIDIQKYSAFAAGASAFTVAAGAEFTLTGSPMNGLRPGSGAGPVIGCSIATPSSCGGVWPIESGPVGQGAVKMENGDGTFGGQVSFYLPNGTRNGYVGRASTGGMIVSPDSGNLNLEHGVGGGVVIVGIPVSCTGLASGTLWNNAGAVAVCP